MIKNYSLNLLQTYPRLTLVLQKIYPLVLIDAYLRLIQCNFLLPNGFLNTISHLGRPNDWWVQNFNHAVQLYEILILFFMGYLLTEYFNKHSQFLLGFCTILILALVCFNSGRDPHNSILAPPLFVIVLISWIVARLFSKLPGKVLPIIMSLVSGSLLNQINLNTLFMKLPGISTSSHHFNWWVILPLTVIRNGASWLGMIDPFMAAKQAINSPAATANLATALSQKTLNHVPHPLNSHTIYSSYAFLGGIGCTLGLLIALYLLHQDRLVLENLIPSTFGFNAPLLFALPLYANPILLIPYLLSPLASMLIGGLFIQLHWAQPAVYQIFSGTPSFLINFLGTNGNWGSLIATILAIGVSTIIYYPFIKYEVSHENQNVD